MVASEDFDLSNSQPDQGEEEKSLSFVALSDDGKAILFNQDLNYRIALPLKKLANKRTGEMRSIIAGLIYEGCEKFNFNYQGQDNVARHADEIVTQLLLKNANEARAAREEEEEQQLQAAAAPELTEELTREVTFEYIADILSISIKKDKAPKLITFCAMLLAQTNKDQLNVGFQAESSAGKSYIPLELASYFPQNEIMKIGSASPTSFYHKGGTWDENRKAIICDLEHRNIIFLDMPHFQLLEKLRPVLSHDDKELHYMITDKNRSGAIRTKNIIIRGYPSVFFCTAKTDPDEQEKTRLLLLSPSIDQEKLLESLELAALRNGNPEEYRKVIEQDPKRKWLIDRIYALRHGGTREILIPDNGKVVFDRFIQEHEHLIARHQRDLPRIFGFVKAHALLNSFHREHNERADTIIANEADIDAGFGLYKEIEESNEQGLSPYIYRIYKEAIEPHLDAIKGLSRKDIRSNYFSVFHKSLPPKFEDSIIQQLEAAGLIQQEPDPDDKRKMLVYPTIAGGGDDSENISPDTLSTYQNNDNDDENKVLSVSGDISQDNEQINPLIQKAMGDKGYCTRDDFVFTSQMEPNLHWSETKVEEAFDAMIQDGRLEEFEPDKYRPTQKLREAGGAYL
jgi:hypothetical protein